MRPIGVDLFAGAGGMSLGFEQAGFDVLAAVEIDPVHAATHEYNFPDAATFAESIKRLSGERLRRESKIGNRPVTCVFGGAPCQGFSMIGKRALDDPRNALVKEFARIVVELDARTFVFENVKGLTLGTHKILLEEIVEAFDHAGYACRLPWKVLNAANFETPQSRERLILIGAKKDAVLPDYPSPLTNIPGNKKSRLPDLPAAPDCLQALDDLPDADNFPELLHSDAIETNDFKTPSAYAARLRGLTEDCWHSGYPRVWNPALLTSSARTKHTEISRKRFSETRQGTVEPVSRFFRLAENGVSNTLRAGTDGARGAFTSPRPIHYKYNRCITVREMARLHGFPDWFRFNATKWHGARQIGNAVPPPLAKAVADAILQSQGLKTKRAPAAIQLGKPELLYFNVSQAAAYFGVAPPPSKRDRKSGAKKRKQEEIELQRLQFENS